MLVASNYSFFSLLHPGETELLPVIRGTEELPAGWQQRRLPLPLSPSANPMTCSLRHTELAPETESAQSHSKSTNR